MDVGEPLIAREAVGEFLCFRDIRTVNHHIRAEFAATRLLDEWRHLGHHHRDGNVEIATMPSERQRVIASTRRDNTRAAFSSRELQHRVARAAFFETARALLILKFDEDIAARDLRQRG